MGSTKEDIVSVAIDYLLDGEVTLDRLNTFNAGSVHDRNKVTVREAINELRRRKFTGWEEIIRVSSATVGRWAGYQKIAILKVFPGVKPHQTVISEYGYGVVEVVARWGPSYIGKTDKCGASKDLAEAEAYLSRNTPENT